MTTLLQNATPYLNYQPYNFTVFVVCFLTVPQSSKCIQISKVYLRIIKKYAWLGLLIQSKYRSCFSHHKAVILHFLVIVWVITWATTAASQGFAGRWEFAGFCGEPGGCRSCCGFYSGVEPMCRAAAAGEGSPAPLDQGSCCLAGCPCVGVRLAPRWAVWGAQPPYRRVRLTPMTGQGIRSAGLESGGEELHRPPLLLGDPTVRLASHGVKPWC